MLLTKNLRIKSIWIISRRKEITNLLLLFVATEQHVSSTYHVSNDSKTPRAWSQTRVRCIRLHWALITCVFWMTIFWKLGFLLSLCVTSLWTGNDSAETSIKTEHTKAKRIKTWAKGRCKGKRHRWSSKFLKQIANYLNTIDKFMIIIIAVNKLLRKKLAADG